MGITPDLYHSNEGHSAFISLERLRSLITDHHLTFNQALEVSKNIDSVYYSYACPGRS
jgi:glucan phosphorylase